MGIEGNPYNPNDETSEVRRVLGVEFHIDNRAEAPEQIVDAVTDAAAWVWADLTDNEPTSMNLAFGEEIVLHDPSGEIYKPNAAYFPESDTIAISTSRLDKDAGTPEVARFIATLRGAHESTHRVQNRYRGQEVPLGNRLTQEEYENDPHEIEADIHSFRAVSVIYPESHGTIYKGQRAYTIPSSPDAIGEICPDAEEIVRELNVRKK